MSEHKTPSLSAFLSIKYWPTWCGISLLWLSAYTPFSCKMAFGRCLGLLTLHLARDRRYITQVNIKHCFPDLNTDGQKKLVRESFIENGIGLVESVSAWARGAEYFRPHVRFIGFEAAESALAQGKGLLILGAHFSTLDLGGALLALRLPYAATYRPHNNPLFDALIYRGRLKICTPLDRNDIRSVYRHLKKGQTLWYAPDQDYHRSEHSVFAPFFGKVASTITTPARFAKANQSPVFIIRHHRITSTKSYEVELIPVNRSFPSGDSVQDATLINAELEKVIRLFPAQYLWMHKRFKTQQQGKPASPYVNIKTSCKSLSAAQFEQLTANITSNAALLSDQQPSLNTETGFHLKIKHFPGIPSKLRGSKHPARRFDQYAKQLRIHGINSITVDSLFTIQAHNMTAACYFSPRGVPLDNLLQNSHSRFPHKALATFFAKLHQAGFYLTNIQLSMLVLTKNDVSLLNPEDLILYPSSVAFTLRIENLLDVMLQCKLPTAETNGLCTHYAKAAELEHHPQFLPMLNTLPTLCSNALKG